MTHVKICGLRDAAMADVVIECGADHVGFVHFPKSPRHVDLGQLHALARHVNGRATSWAVTASPDDETLLGLAAMAPDLGGVQIHGVISDDIIARMRAIAPDLLIMRAVSVATKEDLGRVADYEDADYLLFDAKPRPDDTLPGGNGVRFDWDILTDLQTDKPWFLAGGLDSFNVAQAISASGAKGVDVSSGVERAPGVKDPQRITQFIQAARSL